MKEKSVPDQHLYFTPYQKETTVCYLPHLRAVGYRRVSSQEQTEGHSLDAQTTHIQNFIQSQGWSLVQLYTDAGISAKKGSHRPAFEQMLKDAQKGQFDVIVVDKIDRFYRHLTGLLTALDQLNGMGVSLASVQEKLDLTTPWGKLMLTVLGHARGDLHR